MGKERLKALQRRWRAESLVYCLLLAVAGSVLLTAGLQAGAGWPWWVGGPVLLVLLAVALMLYPYWRMSLTDISRYLDRLLPELEESCGLLLRDGDELGPLERLQAARVEMSLSSTAAPHPLRKRLAGACGILALALLLSAGLRGLAGWRAEHAAVVGAGVTARAGAATVPPAPGIRAVHIRIVPPAYTGRPVREQPGLSVEAEQGAVLSWELETTAPVDTVQFLINDTTRVTLRPVGAEGRVWQLVMPVMRSGFYQVRTGAQLSGLYKLEVKADEPPEVTIVTPKPYTVVDYGESTKIPLQVRLKDDYGIAGASVIATVASGRGEAVRFKEQELKWAGAFGDERPLYALSRVLDLGALGLKPGDELYFYCRAKDSHGQESRTETYIISWTDTAQLMSLEGMTVSTDVKPEYFRSERQIIIETEQLLREKDTLALTPFHNRSNDLGIDQKLLRLRYGKFLGEEAEEGEPGGGGAEDTTDFGAFGDATKILDVYTDKHDNAEDATYFEPGVKRQLKATLDEMWKAELKLRTFQPQEALPFAYKALRLLKDLQQQSRVYVAKTGLRVTPLNPARRLTGELKDIQPPVQQVAAAKGLTEEETLRMALAVLEEVRARMGVGPVGAGQGSAAGLQAVVMGDADRVVLRQAASRMGREAAARPGEYLDAYQGLRTIAGGGGGGKADIPAIERAITRLLPVAEQVPGEEWGMADGGLGDLYFHQLNDHR